MEGRSRATRPALFGAVVLVLVTGFALRLRKQQREQAVVEVKPPADLRRCLVDGDCLAVAYRCYCGGPADVTAIHRSYNPLWRETHSQLECGPYYSRAQHTCDATAVCVDRACELRFPGEDAGSADDAGSGEDGG